MLDGFKKLIGRKGEVVLVSDDTVGVLDTLGGITADRLTDDIARCSEGNYLGLFIELTIGSDDMEMDAWCEYVAAVASFTGRAIDARELMNEMAAEMSDEYEAEDAADVAANAAPVAPASTWCSTCASVAGVCRH